MNICKLFFQQKFLYIPETTKCQTKGTVFLQNSSGSSLPPSISFELENCFSLLEKKKKKRKKKEIFYSFFFTRMEFYSTHFKVFANLKHEHKTIWRPQIPQGLFISTLRNQSMWWLPERGQCVFVLVTPAWFPIVWRTILVERSF